jgi:DNA replicative helicase MCM subunit Mcm2 (Cdc46/Mcm family)
MSKHSFKCSNCGKDTSTTIDKWYEKRLCADCRGISETSRTVRTVTKRSWIDRHPGLTVLLIILLVLLVAGLIAWAFSVSGL